MFDLIGRVIGEGLNWARGDGGSDAQDHSAQVQREFAQQGIRWRVADAQAAGIHPLFALGAQLPSYQPVHQVGGDAGPDFGGMGQEIGRAIDSTRTASERAESRASALALERGELENQLLRAQIAKLNQQSGPALPAGAGASPYMVDGQGNSPLVSNQPLERVVPSPHASNQEPGAIVSLGWENTGSGVRAVPSKDIKERIEDMPLQEMLWSLRNLMAPNVNWGESRRHIKPPKAALPSGATHWRWNFLAQEWRPHYPAAGEDVRGKTIRLP